MRKNISLLIIAFSLITASAWFFASSSSVAKQTGDIDRFISKLQDDGFIVQEAEFGIIDILGLYDAGYLNSCYGNNPSTPYMIYWVPPAPDEKYNAAEDINLGHKINNKFLIKGLQSSFKMRPDEALVFVGKTPPEVTYFSFRSYLFDRVCGGKRQELFASLGDTTNYRTIWTEGTPGGKKGNPFNQLTLIITTADSNINDRVRSAAKKAGFPEAIMNTDILPSPLIRLGLEENADSFLVLLRLAFFKDKQAGQNYLNNSGARILRITPKTPSANRPFPAPRLRVRGTGTVNELELSQAVADLRKAIIAKHALLKARDLKTSIWLFEGFDALQHEINVLGENRDTVYLRSEDFTLKDDPNEFLMVYGVNHAASGKCLYNNFGIYGTAAVNGIGAVSNLDFAGSAEKYLPGHPLAKYLYAWKVARRSPSDKECLIAPWNRGSHGVDLDKKAFIGFRAYIEPSTNVGPYWPELYYDRVIKFTK